MTAAAILDRLAALGARLEWHGGDRLRLRVGDKPVPADLIAEAKAAKDALVALISEAEERAAIVQHDGGFGRAEAERVAGVPSAGNGERQAP